MNIQVLRALRGVLDNEDALMAEAGDLEVNGFPYPRMQLLSIPEILEGKRFSLPNIAERHELQPRLVSA